MSKRLWINSKIIKPGSNQGHVVKYCIYTEDGDDVAIVKDPGKKFDNIGWSSNSICFASLIHEIHGNKTVNRIMYFIQDKPYKNRLDDQEKTDWISIAKRGLVLPYYVTVDSVLCSTPVVKLVDISPSLLYIYLSSLRVIQENPSFVRAMIYLVAVYQMNFCAAWALASRLVITNSWHNIIEIGRHYCQASKNDVNDLEVDLRLIIGFQRYIKNPCKYDKRKLTDKSAYPYKVHNTIRNLCGLPEVITAGNLFESCVIKAINSDTDKEAKKHLNALN